MPKLSEVYVAAENESIEYVDFNVRDIKVAMETKKNGDIKPNRHVIELEGETLRATGSFWQSIFSRYAINSQVFNLFSPEEVFERIVEHHGDDKMQMMTYSSGETTDKEDKPVRSAYSTCLLGRNFSKFDEVMDLEVADGATARFSPNTSGRIMVESPLIGSSDFEICGDSFGGHFVTSIPIDGYGNSTSAPMLLRRVCSTGAVAMAPVFQSKISKGKNAVETLNRVSSSLTHYSGEEALLACRDRFKAAAVSKASIREVMEFWSAMCKQFPGSDHKCTDEAQKQLFTRVQKKYYELTGDAITLYGVFSNTAMSRRRMSLLESRCTMYELLNFATEVRSHHVNVSGKSTFDGMVGQTLATEFDLENSEVGKKRAYGFQGMYLAV
jgi:hypothetical protein